MNSQDFYTVKINGTDRSLNVKDFNTPAVAMALLAGEFVHVGYYKDFRQLYMHFDVLNVVSTTITFEYYNGTTWTALPSMIDETENWTKSGFLYWERPEDWAAVDVGGDELKYIRMSAANDLTGTTSVKGINVLFSNDKDIEGVRSNIVSKHNNGDSWIEKHESARRFMIQRLRNLGHRKAKVDETSGLFFDSKEDVKTYSNLTQFDLIDPFELREASKYFVLSMIYLDELTDEIDDKWERAGLRHEAKAENLLDLFMLRIDRDDDGREDVEENEGETRTDLTWA